MDLDSFLERPLVARVATHGPRVRPVWFLWEQGRLWWLTGPDSGLRRQVEQHPQVAVVIDTCDLEGGAVHQVTMLGPATIEPYDAARATRKLRRYLEPRVEIWIHDSTRQEWNRARLSSA